MAAKMSMTKRLEAIAKAGFITADQITYEYVDFIEPFTRTPVLCLEWLTGVRGFVLGRLVLVEAQQAVGKSALCWLFHAMFHAQNDNVFGSHMETEGAMPPADFIALFGTDVKRLLVMKELCNFAEATVEIDNSVALLRELDDTTPLLVTLDSISGLGVRDQEKLALKSDRKQGIGEMAKAVGAWIRDERGGKWWESKRAVPVITGQLRSKVDSSGQKSFGPKNPLDDMVTLASAPLRFQATYQFQLSQTALMNSEAKRCGNMMRIKVRKNKMAEPNRAIKLPMPTGKGFDLAGADIAFLFDQNGLRLPDGTIFELSRGQKYLSCPLLFPDKTVEKGDEGERVMRNALYTNPKVLAGIREALRIRGFGFAFEKNFKPNQFDVPLDEVTGYPLGADEGDDEDAEDAE